MLRQSLALVTPPDSEPVSLAEVKAFCKVDGTDEDALLSTLITTARQFAEEYLRRSLFTQTWKLTLDLGQDHGQWWDGVQTGAVSSLYGAMPRTIPLPKGPVSAITSVTTYDSINTAATYDAANYRVDASGDRLILNSGASWPSSIRPQAGCEILYVAGYGDKDAVPKPIKTGILTHVASLYEQRGQCDDPMPVAVERLYARYRIMGDRLG